MEITPSFRRNTFYLLLFLLIFGAIGAAGYKYYFYQASLQSDREALKRLIASKKAKDASHRGSGRDRIDPDEDAAILFTVEEPPISLEGDRESRRESRR